MRSFKLCTLFGLHSSTYLMGLLISSKELMHHNLLPKGRQLLKAIECRGVDIHLIIYKNMEQDERSLTEILGISEDRRLFIIDKTAEIAAKYSERLIENISETGREDIDDTNFPRFSLLQDCTNLGESENEKIYCAFIAGALTEEIPKRTLVLCKILRIQKMINDN